MKDLVRKAHHSMPIRSGAGIKSAIVPLALLCLLLCSCNTSTNNQPAQNSVSVPSPPTSSPPPSQSIASSAALQAGQTAKPMQQPSAPPSEKPVSLNFSSTRAEMIAQGRRGHIGHLPDDVTRTPVTQVVLTNDTISFIARVTHPPKEKNGTSQSKYEQTFRLVMQPIDWKRGLEYYSDQSNKTRCIKYEDETKIDGAARFSGYFFGGPPHIRLKIMPLKNGTSTGLVHWNLGSVDIRGAFSATKPSKP